MIAPPGSILSACHSYMIFDADGVVEP